MIPADALGPFADPDDRWRCSSAVLGLRPGPDVPPGPSSKSMSACGQWCWQVSLRDQYAPGRYEAGRPDLPVRQTCSSSGGRASAWSRRGEAGERRMMLAADRALGETLPGDDKDPAGLR